MAKKADDIVVSIVVPVHNDEEYLSRALKSCLAQNYRSLQIVCVNDGSTDGSQGILTAFEHEDTRIQVISFNQNKGAHNARRAGVVAATGSLVVFLDADDQLPSGACGAVVHEFVREPFDILQGSVQVKGDGVVTQEDVQQMQTWLHPDKGTLAGRGIVDNSFVYNTVPFNVWGKAYRTHAVQQAFDWLGSCTSSYAEDAMEYFAIALAAETFRTTNKSLYTYHLGAGISGEQMMDAAKFERLLTGKTAVENVRRMLQEQGIFNEYADAFASFSAGHVRFLLNEWNRSVGAQDKAACLSAVLALWPQDDVASIVCGFGRDGLETLKSCIPDFSPTEEQLISCGYAEGVADTRKEYEQSASYKAGRVATTLPRMIAGLVRR